MVGWKFSCINIGLLSLFMNLQLNVIYYSGNICVLLVVCNNIQFGSQVLFAVNSRYLCLHIPISAAFYNFSSCMHLINSKLP